LIGDESEALTYPYLAHSWARRGADLRVEAPGQTRKRALLGVLDHATGKLIVITRATKRSSDFADLLACLDRSYGPRPDRASRPMVLVLDNGPIHTGKASSKVLATRPWLRIEWLPRYAPQGERHRAFLARPEATLLGAADLPGRRASRQRLPCCRLRPQP
jgi:hypothetical protein